QITAEPHCIHAFEEKGAVAAKQILHIVLGADAKKIDAGLVHQTIEAIRIEGNCARGALGHVEHDWELRSACERAFSCDSSDRYGRASGNKRASRLSRVPRRGCCIAPRSSCKHPAQSRSSPHRLPAWRAGSRLPQEGVSSG